MGNCNTLYDKLLYIKETKDLIRAAIEANDVEVLDSDTFRKYAEYIADIQKVKSVNGEIGDVIVNAEKLGVYTKEEVDDIVDDIETEIKSSVWIGTQQEFDALEEINPNITYYISEDK